MANKFYAANKLVGGTAGCLDDISYTVLTNGDGAIVIDATTDTSYRYTYDSSSAATASTPSVITPADNLGNGRWLLTGAVESDVTLAAGATATEISVDETMAGDSDTVISTEQAIRKFVHAQFIGHAYLPYCYANANGGATEYNVVLGPAKWHIYSATYGHRMIDTAGEVVIDTSGVSGTDWWYVYVDDSAITDTLGGTVTASEFYVSNTVPTVSAVKGGYYSGEDRCVFAFYVLSGAVRSFDMWQQGLVLWGSELGLRSRTDLDTTWTDVTAINADGICKNILCTFRLYASGDTDPGAYWRKDGTTEDGHLVAAGRTSGESANTSVVNVTTAGVFEVKMDVSGTASLGIGQNGYYLPESF